MDVRCLSQPAPITVSGQVSRPYQVSGELSCPHKSKIHPKSNLLLKSEIKIEYTTQIKNLKSVLIYQILNLRWTHVRTHQNAVKIKQTLKPSQDLINIATDWILKVSQSKSSTLIDIPRIGIYFCRFVALDNGHGGGDRERNRSIAASETITRSRRRSGQSTSSFLPVKLIQRLGARARLWATWLESSDDWEKLNPPMGLRNPATGLDLCQRWWRRRQQDLGHKFYVRFWEE